MARSRQETGTEKAKVPMLTVTELQTELERGDRAFLVSTLASLRSGMMVCVRIAAVEKTLKKEKDETHAVMKDCMDKLNIKSLKDEEVGTATMSSQIRTSIDKNKLISNLLEKGMTPDVITEVLDASTNVTVTKESVSFRTEAHQESDEE